MEGGEVNDDALSVDEWLRFAAHSSVTSGKWLTYDEAMALKASDPEKWASAVNDWKVSDASLRDAKIADLWGAK
jgi:hypothetical protein